MFFLCALLFRFLVRQWVVLIRHMPTIRKISSLEELGDVAKLITDIAMDRIVHPSNS